MSDESPLVEVVRNDLEDRYEIHVGDQLAGFAQYRDEGDRRVFFHTEISTLFEGRGLGTVLALHAVEETIAQGKKIVPTCPFIAAWLRRHPDYEPHVLWSEATEAGNPA